MRDEFYKVHWNELVEETVTLCNKHHVMLHKAYGREPAISSAKKQEHWVNKMNAKFQGGDMEVPVGMDSTNTDTCNRFTRFITTPSESNRFAKYLK